MKTITLDIIDDKALNLLKDLELLNVIKLHDADNSEARLKNFSRHKGSMTKQPIEAIDQQLNDLRKEWD